MPNQFHTKPEFQTELEVASSWLCPITGFAVPKDGLANLMFRSKILEEAEDDYEFQQDLYTACSHSFLFFINVFGWTLRVFEPGSDGETRQAKEKNIPFITWNIQDTHLLWLEQHMDDGEDGLTDKSRDMGATWNHIALYVHRFLFRPDESHLLLSRKEDTVDQLDGLPKNYPHGPLADPGTLFGKVDYMLSRLPQWMLPSMSRKKMHLVNLDSKCRLDGESANATAGSSDRRTSILMDEMAKMDEGESIKRSTADVAACRFPCSTPNGAGTAYSKWRMGGQIDVFPLAWWEHPEKGRDRYIEEFEIGGSVRYKIRSPWYNNEERKRSPKELAIEIDMDHVGSGDVFFETDVIEKQKAVHAREPSRYLAVDFRSDVYAHDIPALYTQWKNPKTVAKVNIVPNGPLAVWCALPGGRPDQTKEYVIGVDISKGQGASNSVANIMCKETGEKIASWADAETPPHVFARHVAAMALWVGGRSLPLVIWENNGDPGLDFGREFVYNIRYPIIYFDRVEGTLDQKRGKRYGWRSSQEQKAIGLGLLRRSYAHGNYINHCRKSLDEALTYISFDAGGIGPADLVEESSNARKAHGDRVIADMLCLVGRGEAGGAKQETGKPPVDSAGHRYQEYLKKRKNARKNPDDPAYEQPVPVLEHFGVA